MSDQNIFVHVAINCGIDHLLPNAMLLYTNHVRTKFSIYGTWADHIIIQAVANTINLRINITESALNFSDSTIVSSIYTQPEGRNARDIYIGHLDELHYVSTTPITQSFSVQANQTTSAKAKLKLNSRDSQSNVKTFSNGAALMENLDNRKKYMKEYMKQRRKDNELKKEELARKKPIIKNIKV